jgi:flagellar hook assembly protein FlgD
LRRALFAALACLLLLLGLPVGPALAGSSAKVVIVVGPVAEHTAHYKADADDIATEARRWTSNVAVIKTPNATWARVRTALQGASIVVYLGHGNGWPSIYAPFQTVTKDGLGLDPGTGADSTKVVYYGEDYLRANIRLAPNAVVLLYHLCYASGNTEPGLAVGSIADSRQRVDNYGAGFIGAGARAVFAEGHPEHPVTSYIRQLFTTNRTMNQIFRSSPAAHGHVQGPFPAQRTPGLQYEQDPDSAAPSGFYRSLVGDLSLTASHVTGALPAPTDTDPADFVVPGATEVQAADGADVFGTSAAAADGTATPAEVLPDGTHLRITAEADAAADGTRIFAVSGMGGTARGFVRGSQLVPRDSTNVALWTLDQSGALLSPNGDGVSDRLVVAARFSEPVASTLTVRNAAGSIVRSSTISGEIAIHAWNLNLSTGAVAPDGRYTWSLKASDPWGNGTVSKSGSFTIDHTPPATKAAVAGTAGTNGWLVSPASITLTATDALSGVKVVNWRLDGGKAVTYAPPAVVTANGTHAFEYRAIDKAGIREGWKSLTLKIDTKAPTIALPVTGTKGAVAETWRSDVTITPSIKDNASGVAARSISIDGAAGVPLPADPIVIHGDGVHAVIVRARDAAGNATGTKIEFTIDTTAPVVELPATPPTPPTVTPNGDGRTEQVTLPFSGSEAGRVAVSITNTAAKVVRTFALPLPAGDATVSWDGRTATGAPVPDGRYTVTFSPTDVAGNPGKPVTELVDVYAALMGVTRTSALFFPQDGDKLAATTRAGWTLKAPATVTIQVLDATGKAVRSTTPRALAAGAGSWAWNGKDDAGAYVPRGTYRIVVAATNGVQAAGQAVTVLADAFRVTTSTTTATRGKAITVTATSAEPLSSAPTLIVRQPGMADWTVRMTAKGATWTATITPKQSGTAGTMTLFVRGRDTAGGRNQSGMRLAIQ